MTGDQKRRREANRSLTFSFTATQSSRKMPHNLLLSGPANTKLVKNAMRRPQHTTYTLRFSDTRLAQNVMHRPPSTARTKRFNPHFSTNDRGRASSGLRRVPLRVRCRAHTSILQTNKNKSCLTCTRLKIIQASPQGGGDTRSAPTNEAPRRERGRGLYSGLSFGLILGKATPL